MLAGAPIDAHYYAGFDGFACVDAPLAPQRLSQIVHWNAMFLHSIRKRRQAAARQMLTFSYLKRL